MACERTNPTSLPLMFRWRCYAACWVCLTCRSRLCLNCAAVFWLPLLTSATAQQQHSSRASCWKRSITEYAKGTTCVPALDNDRMSFYYIPAGAVSVRTSLQMSSHCRDIAVQPLSQTNVPRSNWTSSREKEHRWGQGCDHLLTLTAVRGDQLLTEQTWSWHGSSVLVQVRANKTGALMLWRPEPWPCSSPLTSIDRLLLIFALFSGNPQAELLNRLIEGCLDSHYRLLVLQ